MDRGTKTAAERLNRALTRGGGVSRRHREPPLLPPRRLLRAGAAVRDPDPVVPDVSAKALRHAIGAVDLGAPGGDPGRCAGSFATPCTGATRPTSSAWWVVTNGALARHATATRRSARMHP